MAIRKSWPLASTGVSWLLACLILAGEEEANTGVAYGNAWRGRRLKAAAGYRRTIAAA